MKTLRRLLLAIVAVGRFTSKRLELELTMKNLTNRTFYTTRAFFEDEILTYSYTLRPAECLLTAKLKL